MTYANTLPGAFTYDDKAIIRDNPRIQAPGRVGEIFRTSYFGGTAGTGSAYRPVLLLSFAVQWWIHAGSAALFHLGNVLLHIAATLLLWRLLLRLGLPPPVSLAAALLFAVHPIHVEAVTSLVGRGETLAAVFVLLFLLAALRVGSRLRTGAALCAAVVCYGLGLLTKESVAVAPGLAFLALAVSAEGGLGRRLASALRRGWPLYLASAAVLAGLFALRTRVLGGAIHSTGTGLYELENPLAPLAPLPRAWNALILLVRYAGRTVFPLELTADESAWSLPVWTGRSWVARIALLLILAAGFTALARLASRRAPAFGLLFFGVAFLPAANLFFPTGTIFAERLAYLPSAGLCLVLAAAVTGGAADFAAISRGRTAALALVAALFAGRAVLRNTIWRSDRALFENSVATSPGSAKAWYNDGLIAIDRGDPRRGRESAGHAIAIFADYWDAYAVRGSAEKKLGLLAEAEASYAKSVELNDSYENGWFGLGVVREARGDLAGAEEAYDSGLEEKTDSFPLALALAKVRSALDRPDADADWERAIALAPGYLPARLAFADRLARRGRDAEARRQWREALRRQPLNLEALRRLASSSESGGRCLSECLAREKVWRVSRDKADRARLDGAAPACAEYAARWKTLPPD